MNLTDWLEAEKGRATAIAAHFEISRAAVSQWKTNGVPVDNMKAVRDFTNNEVTLEEMVPEAHSRPLIDVATAAQGG